MDGRDRVGAPKGALLCPIHRTAMGAAGHPALPADPAFSGDHCDADQQRSNISKDAPNWKDEEDGVILPL